eukprot:6181031-Pleurochrysis_carterae.AAC.3
MEARVLASALRNSTELCAAVLQGLSMADQDTREKAVDALAGLLDAGLLHGALEPGAQREENAGFVSRASCSLSRVQKALEAFTAECDVRKSCGETHATARDLLGKLRALEM